MRREIPGTARQNSHLSEECRKLKVRFAPRPARSNICQSEQQPPDHEDGGHQEELIEVDSEGKIPPYET